MAGGTSAPATLSSVGGEAETHASEHQSGGNDEINVGGLAGDLADAQDPKAHSLAGASHNSDTLANLNSKVSDATLDDQTASRPPDTHNNTAHSETYITSADAGPSYTDTGSVTLSNSEEYISVSSPSNGEPYYVNAEHNTSTFSAYHLGWQMYESSRDTVRTHNNASDLIVPNSDSQIGFRYTGGGTHSMDYYIWSWV